MGSRTKNNHYLSQCISKNFLVKKGEPFWEYDFDTKMGPQVKGLERLFSGRGLWSQELENAIGKGMENKLAEILKRMATETITCHQERNGNQITVPQFNGYMVGDENERQILQKLILQTFLLQHSHSQKSNQESENVLQQLFDGTDLNINMDIALLEINPLLLHPPLILTDGMLFLYVVPEAESEKVLGHICFMFPISPERFLLWGQKADADYFVMKFKNIDFLNLCRIEQHGKKCKVATQDKAYLDSLMKRVPYFNSGLQPEIRIERG